MYLQCSASSPSPSQSSPCAVALVVGVGVQQSQCIVSGPSCHQLTHVAWSVWPLLQGRHATLLVTEWISRPTLLSSVFCFGLDAESFSFFSFTVPFFFSGVPSSSLSRQMTPSALSVSDISHEALQICWGHLAMVFSCHRNFTSFPCAVSSLFAVISAGVIGLWVVGSASQDPVVGSDPIPN